MSLARLARLGITPILGLTPLLGFGCSDPVPATPKGAWSISFESPGATCPVNGHNAVMGDVTDRTKKSVLVDGEGGASVDCRVSGSGSFTVSASASDVEKSVGMTLVINSISPGATVDEPATGGISFSSPTTGGEPAVSANDMPCIFYFVPDSGEGVAEGKIWVAFQCDKMILDQSDGCRIKQGYAIFENCET